MPMAPNCATPLQSFLNACYARGTLSSIYSLFLPIMATRRLLKSFHFPEVFRIGEGRILLVFTASGAVCKYVNRIEWLKFNTLCWSPHILNTRSFSLFPNLNLALPQNISLNLCAISLQHLPPYALLIGWIFLSFMLELIMLNAGLFAVNGSFTWNDLPPLLRVNLMSGISPTTRNSECRLGSEIVMCNDFYL